MSKFNARKLKRDILRQIISFQNLSQNQEFKKDIELIRKKFEKIWPGEYEEINIIWNRFLKRRVIRERKLAFNIFKSLNKKPPATHIDRSKSRQAPKISFHNFLGKLPTPSFIKSSNLSSHGFKDDIDSFVNKWHVRQADAVGIIFGNDYPPYFCMNHRYLALFRDLDGTSAAELSKKKRKTRNPKRFWWERRVKDKTLEHLVWSQYLKGKRQSDIYKNLPNSIFVTPDAVKKIIQRKKLRQGTIMTK